MIMTALVFSAVLAAAAPEDAAPAKTAKTTAVAPDNTPDPLQAGLVAFKQKKFARAEDDFEKAAEENPQSAAAHFYLGYSIYKTVEHKKPFHPDKQKAAAEFQKAYELDPNFTPEWGKGPGKPASTK